jgi:RNA polymerase sigma-70 factor (ECF subfamily)
VTISANGSGAAGISGGVTDVRRELTAEMAWIRRLAFALVRDDATADDVAQETWLAAADHTPEDGPKRPWLRRVVLNVVRMRGRGAKRRDKHERDAGYSDAQAPSPDELVERVEIQRIVSGEVLALAEPYRSTVLMHFVDELSCADIARRLGIPDGTVRRRLKVALDHLRARLRERDDKRLALLAPLLIPRPSHAATLVGAAVMKKLVIATLVILLVLVGIFALWHRGRGDAQTPSNAHSPVATGGGAHRRDALAGDDIPAWALQPGAGPRRIAGHVVSTAGPVAKATVRLGLELPGVLQTVAEVETGPDGAFDFGERPAATFSVAAEATGFAPSHIEIALANPRTKPEAIVIALGACRSRIFGSIVDASGGPIPKARLSVAGLGGTDADDKGQYSLCIRPRDAHVRIEADGYASLEVPIHLVGDLRHDFALVPEAVLTGHVVDEAGHAVAGARVVADPDPFEHDHFVADNWTVSDADGRFRIANLAPSRFRVSAYADGLASSAPKPAIASPGVTGKDIELVLTRRARLAGHVMMGDKPVAGARVRTRPESRTSYSQADGSFVIDGVPMGPTRLFAAPYEVKAPLEIKVDRARIDDLVVDVSALGTIKGHVTRRGTPVANAKVTCGQAPPTTSDATGAYVLEGVPAGTCTLDGEEMTEALAFAPGEPVSIAPGETKEIDVELSAGGRARGVVVDENGAPVPGVYVLLTFAEAHDIGESMTNAQGEFECMSMVGGGDYEAAVFASPARGAPFSPASGDRFPPVHIADGNAVATGIRLAIKYERLSIRGHIVDDTGAPVPDAHVEAFARVVTLPPSVRADSAGNFEIGNLTRGLYTVHAHGADASEADVTGIAAGSTNVEIRLVRPGSIDGQLIGFPSPPAVHAMTIAQTMPHGNDGIVDGDHFTILGLAPGTYRVEARSDAGTDGQSVEVKSGQVSHAVLKARGSGSVEGRVTEFGKGTPIAGMTCFAMLSVGGVGGMGDPSKGVVTDAQGRFTIDAPLGKVRIVCGSNPLPFSNAGGDVEVTPGAPAHIDVAAVRVIPPPADIGFAFTPSTLPLTVRTIDPAGPAVGTGLAIGDHVIAIDGAPVDGLLPYSALVLCTNHRPGTTLVLTVEHGGATQTVRIPITKLASWSQ